MMGNNPNPIPRTPLAGSYRENTDPALLDRTVDAILQQDYHEQASRLPHRAGEAGRRGRERYPRTC